MQYIAGLPSRHFASGSLLFTTFLKCCACTTTNKSIPMRNMVVMLFIQSNNIWYGNGTTQIVQLDNLILKLQQYMQEKEVLELIQKAVAPLRERLVQLETENQKLNAQVGRVGTQIHNLQSRGRQRSHSKDGTGVLKKEQNVSVKSPSIKKRQESGSKPSWNIGKIKPDTVHVKSPGKNLPPSQIPKSPAGKPTPKDVIGSEKNVDTPKKIAGGKKKENNCQQNRHISPESEDNREP